MVTKINTTALLGIDAYKVEVEVDLRRSGLPGFTLVGLAEGAARESKERVFSALKNCGFSIPPARITVNLAPADIKKDGSAFDLPLAIGLLVASGIIPAKVCKSYFFMGELSLFGDIKAVTGSLAACSLAKNEQAQGFLLPRDNALEGAVVKDISVFGVKTLLDVIKFLLGEINLVKTTIDVDVLWKKRSGKNLDFIDVKGQDHAKRAIEVAAAGNHNIIFSGNPGSGKTMLAKRIPSVLPPLCFEESLEVTKIYSAINKRTDGALIIERPFRSPHHTISDAGLIGGGAHPRPGEVTLAHLGVLFLDEMSEFKKHVLEVLRQPLEDGHVTISRAAMSIMYPARFMLVGALNPCPCGFFGDLKHTCVCSTAQIQRYRAKLSGPLLDRIDIQIEVPAIEYKEFRSTTPSRDSASILTNVLRVRELQYQRYLGLPFSTNAELYGDAFERYCFIDEAGHNFIDKAVNKLGFSARAITKIFKIARTIADLENKENIEIHHLAEAVNYRSLDRSSF